MLVEENGLKGLRCVFSDNVLCSYRKSLKSGIMERCFSCRHYFASMREMEKQEDEFWKEHDEIREIEARFKRGEFDEEEYRKRCFEVYERYEESE